MGVFETLYNCTGFEWDDGNSEKIWIKHHVIPSECEQVFFQQPLVVAEDVKHSQHEIRYYALGQTDMGRLLFAVFTIRSNLIRIVSARDMNRKEKRIYRHYEKENT